MPPEVMSLHWEIWQNCATQFYGFRLGHLCGQSLVNFRLCFLTWRWCISWSSKKQATVTTSSTEAGNGKLSCDKRPCGFMHFVNLIGFEKKQPTLISCDNNGLNMLGQDPSFHKWTKHIDIQYHYVCEWVEAKDTIFSHILSCKIQQMC